MLHELAVQNLALIEDVHVELKPGFCAWTGETGAGKSLLLGALGLLLGERGSTELLRAGAEELSVTGVFELTPELKKQAETILDGSLEEETLILRRRLNKAGRGQAYVNDQPVAVNTLKRLGNILVDLHGQRESLLLLEPSYQLELLDAFGQLEGPRQKYLQLAERCRKLRTRFQELSAAREQRKRDLSLLRFEREELAEANLQPGELPELQTEREKLTHAQALQTFALGSCGRLYDEEGSIVDQLGKIVKEGDHWSAVDPKLTEVVQRLEGVLTEIRDLADTLRDLGEGYEADPGRLEEVDRRLQLLRRLETKYARPLEELVPYLESLDAREKELEQAEDDLAQVETELRQQFVELKEAAQTLSKQRVKVAKKLAAETQKHLADLGMPDARLTAQLEVVPLGDDPTTVEIPSFGIDRVELMLAANKGEEARPLRKVASGGEMARTMLALKTVLAAHDPVGTLIFDEIDANVGGRLGDVIGEKLAALGRARQVICVTHLPQVASYARHQWTIRKTRRGDRTSTTIVPLASEERLEELASMLRGEARGETTRQEAAAMLKEAKKHW
jgi:DNA repair protein RecN (Recombination protein N)